ncbi:MAG: hypothetical protein LBQ87_10190 [Candidatus Fibromonas sp.]|nr:hypothetical protein [Candidatus Fibromonas sp.]
MQQSWAFNFADFFAYLKAFFVHKTLGFSDFHYPQTVQHFVLASFPHSFHRFLLILALGLCSFGVFLFISTVKKEMNCNFSRFSCFLRMDKNKVLKQARIAALPKQALYWSVFSPVIFILIFIFEAEFEIPGLGNIIKTAFYLGDFPLLYGSFVCAFFSVLAVNMFFLLIKGILWLFPG